MEPTEPQGENYYNNTIILIIIIIHHQHLHPQHPPDLVNDLRQGRSSFLTLKRSWSEPLSPIPLVFRSGMNTLETDRSAKPYKYQFEFSVKASIISSTVSGYIFSPRTPKPPSPVDS